MTRRRCAVLGLVALLGGCVNGYTVNRGLHYVVGDDGEQQLVRTPPPPPAAYEAYLRARVAMERSPADLVGAREQISLALRWQPREPWLWVVLAEIEWWAGDRERARAALDQALALQPGYGPAEELSGRMTFRAGADGPERSEAPR